MRWKNDKPQEDRGSSREIDQSNIQAKAMGTRGRQRRGCGVQDSILHFDTSFVFSAFQVGLRVYWLNVCDISVWSPVGCAHPICSQTCLEIWLGWGDYGSLCPRVSGHCMSFSGSWFHNMYLMSRLSMSCPDQMQKRIDQQTWMGQWLTTVINQAITCILSLITSSTWVTIKVRDVYSMHPSVIYGWVLLQQHLTQPNPRTNSPKLTEQRHNAKDKITRAIIANMSEAHTSQGTRSPASAQG